MSEHTTGRVLDFIRSHQKEHGYPPTMQEIGTAVGLASLSSVSYQLKKLEAMGKIQRGPGRSRAITITSRRREEEDVGERSSIYPH